MSVAVQSRMRASYCPRLQQVAKSTGAVSRYKAKLALVVVPGYLRFCRQRRESGFIAESVIVQRAENQCKNRDEFINFIVRVIFRQGLKFSSICNLS